MFMSTSVENGSTVAELKGECRRLHAQVDHMQTELAETRQALARVQAERDAYLRSLYAWSRGQVSEEQLRRWATEQDVTGVSFEKLLEELTTSDPA
jgi:hypothetical protein